MQKKKIGGNQKNIAPSSQDSKHRRETGPSRTTGIFFLPKGGDALQRRLLLLRSSGESAAWRPRRWDRLASSRVVVRLLPRRHSRRRIHARAPVPRRMDTLVEALAALDGAGKISDGIVADAPPVVVVIVLLCCIAAGEKPAGYPGE